MPTDQMSDEFYELVSQTAGLFEDITNLAQDKVEKLRKAGQRVARYLEARETAQQTV